MDPLATVGELETYLGRTLDDQAQADTALALASGAVRAYCGWDLSLQNQTMYFEGAKASLITLPTLELLDIVETRANGEILDPAEYPINWSRKGQVWGCFIYQVQYEFDVEHGYDPIPDVLKLVTMDLAQRQLAASATQASNPEGLTSATVGQVTKTWGNTTTSSGSTSTGSSAMSTLHSALLDRYSI